MFGAECKIKLNGLYGEIFADWSELETYKINWLAEVANVRCHGTTSVHDKISYGAPCC